MEEFTGTVDDTHDDIVSALSLLVEIFSPYAEMDNKVNYVQSEFVTDNQNWEKHQMIYGLGKYAKNNAAFASDDNPMTQFAVEKSAQQVVDVPYDPLSDVFGG